MNLYRKFSLMAVFAIGLLTVQCYLLTSWRTPGAGELEYQAVDVVSVALQRLRLEPRLAAAVKPELLREIATQLGEQLVQLIPDCSSSSSSGGSGRTTRSPPRAQGAAAMGGDTTHPPPPPLPPPKLYIITPTYRRPEQLPEMTRLSQTLLHIKNIKWLVIEDASRPTLEIAQLLARTGMDYVHLIAPMPDRYKNKKGNKPRGVSNRNRGLSWIRANATDGVVYFADDDNTYDIRIFEQMRYTKKISMWPVGLLTKYGLSSPVVKNGSFAGFYDGWVAGRKFPVDMAEFAINVKFLLLRPNATMPYKPGFEEDGFLKSLAPFEPKEIELLADNCTQILVWHTQSKKNPVSAPLNETLYKDTNLIELKKHMV